MPPISSPGMYWWSTGDNRPRARERGYQGSAYARSIAVAVSIAKMYASDAARTVGNRGIQVHRGMGFFTWENDLHLYYRRAKVSETSMGDLTYHRERIARLVTLVRFQSRAPRNSATEIL